MGNAPDRPAALMSRATGVFAEGHRPHLDQVSGCAGSYVLDTTSRREGGQAEVFRACGPDGAPVAVRLPRAADTGWFAREVASIDGLAARVHDASSWLVRVIDRGVTSDGRPFIVMPWYEMSLSDWLRTGPSLEQRLLALESACRAVARLHRSGAGELDLLVHRDLKPSNFLVQRHRDGISVILTDLGAAREGAFLATIPNTVIFTRSYSPPEQQLPIQLAPDPNVDVHALAVTLFVGLAGRVPTSVLCRDSLRNADAERLLTLEAFGCERRTDEEEEYQGLTRRPLQSLLDLADARALHPGDEAVLRSVLAERLAGRCPNPEALADRVADKMLPALRRALEPDPARRMGDARILQAACHQALEILTREGVTPPPASVTYTPVEVEREPTSALALPSAGTLPNVPLPPRSQGLPWRAGLGIVAALLVGGGAAFGRFTSPAAPLAVAAPPTVVTRSTPAVVPPPTPSVAPPSPERIAVPPRALAKPKASSPAPVAAVPPDPPTAPKAAAPAPAPPVLEAGCPSVWLVKLDGHPLAPGARPPLGAGDRQVSVYENGLLVARSQVHVAPAEGGWNVSGDWITDAEGAYASGGTVVLTCPLSSH